MHAIRRLLAAASVVAMTGGLGVIGAGAAGAATTHPMPRHHATTATAVVHLVKTPLTSVKGQWATANITRTVTVTRVAGHHHVYTYAATVTDKGTFVTINKAFTPNQFGKFGKFGGMHIRGYVHGTLYGKTVFTFKSHARYVSPPRHLSGVSLATSSWLGQFMHHGYIFKGAVVSSFCTYHAQKGFMRTWTYTPSTLGQTYPSGNITGLVRHHHHH